MKYHKSKKSILIKNIFAIFVGFVNGFFGGGGGLLCVPTLKKIYKLETKKAHATTIAVILPISIFSSIVYIANNNLNLFVVLSVTVGVIVGGILGAILLKKINSSVIRWVFVLVLFSAGVRMII